MSAVAWFDDEAGFAAELARGRRTELGVALRVLPLGKWTRVERFWFRDEACKDPRAADQRDVEVEGGHLLEVKGRRFAFSSPADYPYPTAFVGATRRWQARRRQPCAVILVSEPTGELVVADTATRDEWVVETGLDRRRGFVESSLAVPRELLRPGDWLFDHLAAPCAGRRRLMSANGSAPTIEKRKHGTGHSYKLNGAKAPGATTVLNKGYPKHLEKWAADQSSSYAVDNWDELAEMPISKRLKLIADARFADRDAAARRGTEVHKLARRIIAGETVEVPDELEGHVDAYLAFLDDWQPRELLVETAVASDAGRYCGTHDLLGDLADETRWLLDLKTTRSGVHRESALQLAAYRNAEFYLDGDVVRPMIEVERCGVVWLKADRSYELVPVDASPATFRVFLAAHLIARFDERDDVLGAPLEAPAVADPLEADA